MQIVIDIPDNLLSRINKADSIPDIEGADIVNSINCIRNGKPLPAGHGDLKDVDAIIDDIIRAITYSPQHVIDPDISNCYLLHAPAIIDSENEDKK